MLRSSLDAIRAKLRATFPHIPRIDVNYAPSDFQEPSFYVQWAEYEADSLNVSGYQAQFAWEIVYFPPTDEAGDPDLFDLLETAGRMLAAFMASPVLTAPDGSVFEIVEVQGGRRDDEAYLRIELSADVERERPQYERMNNVRFDDVV